MGRIVSRYEWILIMGLGRAQLILSSMLAEWPPQHPLVQLTRPTRSHTLHHWELPPHILQQARHRLARRRLAAISLTSAFHSQEPIIVSFGSSEPLNLDDSVAQLREHRPVEQGTHAVVQDVLGLSITDFLEEDDTVE